MEQTAVNGENMRRSMQPGQARSRKNVTGITRIAKMTGAYSQIVRYLQTFRP